jgi:hypothetical protein
VWTVYVVPEHEPEYKEGFFETREEAEEVCELLSEELSETCEVRDRWGEPVMVVEAG